MECGTPQGQKNPYSRASVQKAVCMKLVQVGEFFLGKVRLFDVC